MVVLERVTSMNKEALQIALQAINDFLNVATPQAWIEQALEHQDLLLIDHANCEKKAAGTALSLMYRYVEHTDFLQQLSRLAREELRHFEQVLAIMCQRNIPYHTVSASRYAETLRKAVRTHEPAKLIDTLIVGAIIEARSCERFAALYSHLDDTLSAFYYRLLSSEARHFRLYLEYAQALTDEPLEQRISQLVAVDNELITSPDTEFRFHSGVMQ